MSITTSIAGTSKHEPPFFSDVHSVLQNVMGELSRLREGVDTQDALHQQACEMLRKDIEQECHESREGMNKFRYEFDELVHKRVETVVDGLEEMEQTQRLKDRHQQKQINALEEEVRGLRTQLREVTRQWTRFKVHSLDRHRIVNERLLLERESNLPPPVREPITTSKSEQDACALAVGMRARLKGAAQYLRGEDWDRIFREQNSDGTGKISFTEFRAMCRTVLRLQEPDSLLRVVFDSLDMDSSGDISIEELVEFVADPNERMRARLKRAVRETGNDWRKIVKEHDLDNSGQISFSEFRRLCHYRLKMLDRDVHLRQVFKAVDEDQSGEISIRELTAWVEGRR